jgi:hypothetical protein
MSRQHVTHTHVHLSASESVRLARVFGCGALPSGLPIAAVTAGGSGGNRPRISSTHACTRAAYHPNACACAHNVPCEPTDCDLPDRVRC